VSFDQPLDQRVVDTDVPHPVESDGPRATPGRSRAVVASVITTSTEAALRWRRRWLLEIAVEPGA
jgi:hypothetical protein